MARISISRLDKTLKQNISSHQYSDNEMMEIRKVLHNTLQARKKTFWRLTFLMACLLVVMGIFSFFQVGKDNQDAIIFSFVFMSIVCVIVLCVTWILQIGILKNQYHKALIKGYPKLYDKYCL